MPKNLLVLILLLATTALSQELPSNLSAGLFAARAKAAAGCGDFATAEALYQKALQDGFASEEPLIRLSIAQGRRGEAIQLFSDYADRLEAVDRALLQAYLHKTPLNTKLHLSKPHHFLYSGLILAEKGKSTEAREHFDSFIASGQYGREIIEPIVMKELVSDCAMCRERPAERYGQQPLCQTCFSLLADFGWIKQSLHAPTEEHKRLLSNLYGEEVLTDLLGSLEASEEMQALTDLIPRQESLTLIEELAPEVRELYEESSKSSNPSRALGTAIASGPYEQLFSSESAQRSFVQKAKALPDSSELNWILNVANWCHKLSLRPSPDGISKLDLKVAYDFVLGNPDYRLQPTAMFVKIKMAETQAGYFESFLRDRPDDLFLHLVLAQDKDSEFTRSDFERQLKHQLWLVEHYPTTLKSTTTWTSGANDWSSRKLVDAFAKKVREEPEQSDILAAAASFFAIEEQELAMLLLQKCQALEPENPDWPEKIAHQAELLDDPQAELHNLELALDMGHPDQREVLLTSLAMTAFEAGEFERAEEAARELLALAGGSESWNTGNAIHKAHTVLGLLALKNRRIGQAKEHLLDSARVKGSPQLNSFGPNMQLALALLQSDEPTVVIEYLELCRSFWESSAVEHWKESIRNGEIPDFDANLRY